MIVCTIEMCHDDPLCNHYVPLFHICFIYVSYMFHICFIIFLVLCDACHADSLRSRLDCEWFCKAGPTNPTLAQRGLEGPGRCDSKWDQHTQTFSQTLNFYKITKSLPFCVQQSVTPASINGNENNKKMWKNMNNLAVEIGWDRLSLVRSRSHMSIPTCLRLGSQESTGRNGCRTGSCFYISRCFIRKWGGVPDWFINDS